MTAILRLSIPLTVWLIGFSAVYALQGLACSRHWPEALAARPALIAAAAIAATVQALLLVAVLRGPSRSRFVQSASTALAMVALVAAAWTTLPVLATTICH